MRRFLAVVLCFCGLVCAGCEKEVYRAETRLLPDGTIERAIYQPTQRTPQSVQEGTTWAARHGVNRPPENEKRRPPLSSMLQQLQNAKPAPGQPYFLASGTFKTLQAVPDYLEFEAPEGLPKGHLVRRLEQQNLGLMTQWTWEETLTDVVTLKDHRIARQELLTALIELTIATAGDLWGPEYDLKELKQWMQSDLTACLSEMCDLMLERGVRKDLLRDDQKVYDEFFSECAQVWQRYGLNLFDEEGKELPESDRGCRIDEFIAKAIQQRVRNKQGQPIGQAAMKQVLDGLLGRSVTQGMNPSHTDQFTQAWERAAIAKYGSQEKADEQISRLGVRMLGLYLWPVLRSAQDFHYEMSLPGTVVITNGELLNDGLVRWKFPTSLAFPFGITMRAVVLVPDAGALARHFPRAKLNSRTAVMSYFDAVRKDTTLLAALVKLSSEHNREAWQAWRREHPEEADFVNLLEPAGAQK